MRSFEISRDSLSRSFTQWKDMVEGKWIYKRRNEKIMIEGRERRRIEWNIR